MSPYGANARTSRRSRPGRGDTPAGRVASEHGPGFQRFDHLAVARLEKLIAEGDIKPAPSACDRPDGCIRFDAPRVDPREVEIAENELPVRLSRDRLGLNEIAYVVVEGIGRKSQPGKRLDRTAYVHRNGTFGPDLFKRSRIEKKMIDRSLRMQLRNPFLHPGGAKDGVSRRGIGESEVKLPESRRLETAAHTQPKAQVIRRTNEKSDFRSKPRGVVGVRIEAGACTHLDQTQRKPFMLGKGIGLVRRRTFAVGVRSVAVAAQPFLHRAPAQTREMAPFQSASSWASALR